VKRAVSYYAGPEDGEFSAHTPEEYLESFFEDVPDNELEDEVRRRGDVVIVEYRPREVKSEWLSHAAESAWYCIVEEFEAEYGSTYGTLRAPPGVVEALMPAIERLVSRNLCAYWCDEVSRRIWTAEEVLAVLRRGRLRRRRRARKP
jgi:hypothetical protein